MGVYIGLTLLGENKWAQVFSDCGTAAVEPHPPTQASLPRLLSHSVRGRAPLGPWPGLGAHGLGYRKKLSASYKHERFCTHDKLAPEGILQLSVSNWLHAKSHAFLTTGILNFKHLCC